MSDVDELPRFPFEPDAALEPPAELQVVLEVLLRKLPSLDLAVPVQDLRRVEGLVVGGLVELPVRW